MALERYAFAMRFLAQAAVLWAENRLRLRLADLVELQRLESTDEAEHSVLMLTQLELAAVLGVSWQKLNRWLRTLREQGLIELVRPGIIRVCDAERLRALPGTWA